MALFRYNKCSLVAVLVTLLLSTIGATKSDSTPQIRGGDDGFRNLGGRNSVRRGLRAIGQTSVPTSNDGGVAPFIVGGQNTPIGEYPYFVQLEILITYTSNGYRSYFTCGGALVAPDVVLTAAHCVEESDDFDITSVNAYVGTRYWRDINLFSGGSYVEGADCTTIHPDYKPREYTEGGYIKRGTGAFGGNDFVLCRLPEAVKVDTEQIYLELNRDDGFPESDEDKLAIMGFGYTNPNRTGYVYTLQDVVLPYYNDTACSNFWLSRSFTRITDTMLCAWDPTEQTAECGGDSGGPLVSKKDTPDGRVRHVVVGLSSFSSTTCGEFPGVFARVSTASEWIQQTVCEEWGIDDAIPGVCSPVEEVPSDAPSSIPSSAAPSTGPAADSAKPGCTDDDDFRHNGIEKRTCAWAGKNPERCLKAAIKEACPATCGTGGCGGDPVKKEETIASCTDDENFRYQGNENRSCTWVGKDAAKRCKTTKIAEACRATCNTGGCGTPGSGGASCTDDETFRYQGNEKRSCAWAGRDAGVRCNTKISEACPATCNEECQQS